jgi:hypothetical protein
VDKIIKIATLIFWVTIVLSVMVWTVESIDRMIYRRVQTAVIEENIIIQEELLKELKESNSDN